MFGLANSKISIFVPSDITHPNVTGSISTITNRFLQSMASRCLIVGKVPHDMLYLFDYNPIIEIDEENPVAQIEAILANFDTYIPLIEKNYEIQAQNEELSAQNDQIVEQRDELELLLADSPSLRNTWECGFHAAWQKALLPLKKAKT